ncbi:MAG TPA: two-component regulator propeller domain-containing protein [Puia sp.]|jgi:signal transduction histidine kinase/ligand-binding sensor domain-containing protein|nr:two-component regulator propeller domain-containing protein [Puia sp.]
MRFLLLIILTLGCTAAASPQIPTSFEQPDVLVKAGVKRVKCILKDSRGFLWIGTETGLFRFDGTNLDLMQHEADSALGLPNSRIAGLAEDTSGNIWVGTMHGAARLDPWTLVCTVYTPQQKNIDLDFDVKPMISNDGRVWLGGNDGLCVLEGGRFRTVTHAEANAPPNAWYVNSMTQWKGDTMAVGTFDGLVLYNMRNGGFTRLFGGRHMTVTKLHVDRRSRLWMGTWGGGCFMLDSNGRSYSRLAPDKPVHGEFRNIITGILETDSREAPHFWISTEAGVYQVEDPAEQQEGKPECRQIADKGAACIAGDNARYIWIGGQTVTRVFAGHSGFGILPATIKGSVAAIQPVTYDGQPAVAFSTWYVSGGLTVTNPSGTTTYYRRKARGDAENVSGLATDSLGRHWVSTFDGLDILDQRFMPVRGADTLFRARDKLVTKRTYGVLIHRDTAWVAYYRHGLSLYDMHFHLLHSFSKNDGSGLADDLINRMVADKVGRVWLGGGKGLYEYDAAAGRFRLFNLNPDGSPFEVSDIATLPGGDLILSTTSGIFRFSPATGASSKIRSPLFPDNVIETAAVDKGGDIWFMNREHLVYYQVNSGHFTLFGTEDGLDTRQDLSTLRCPDGEHFYLAGDHLIYTFNRNIRNIAAQPVPLYLHSIQVDDSTLPRNAGVPPLHLNYKQDRITIEFGAINLVKPEQNLYAYMLTGVDTRWIYSTRNYASYANLAPGGYTFRLKVENDAGTWSDVLSLPVAIHPPYWATWWFRLLGLTLIGVAVVLSVRYVVQRNLRERILRLQREQAVEKERNRIARDMHDDLGSGLTKIAIMSEVTKAQLAVPGAAVTNLDVISNASRELVDNLQDIVWVLNPRNDSIGSLLLYLKEYVEDFFEPTGISCTVVANTVAHDIPISEEKRRNIFLTVKEACNNILKYAECKEVGLAVRIDSRRLTIKLEDNGNGFDIREVGPFANGLKNMRNRIEQIGGRFQMESEKEIGTIVNIEVPV